MRPIVDLGSLPFHVGPGATPRLGGLPDTLPFTVAVHEGRVVQAPCAAVSHALAAAYARGSQIGTPLAADGLGQRYADDFLGFLAPLVGRGARVLEIGAGNGHLLERLSALGAVCEGVDPGWPADRPGAVVRATFPTARIAGPVDLVVHYCVLEHIEDPAAFMRAQVALLRPGGRVVLAVPDTAPQLEVGDVSMFVHEHWSYFTAASLRGLLHRAGLSVRRLERSGYGGLLYVEAVPWDDPAVEPAASPQPAPSPDDLATRIHRYLARARRLLSSAGTVGVLPAFRFLNLVHLLDLPSCPRLFDDDPRLHGRYFAPLPRPIESRDDLRRDPVDRLVVSSAAFGAALCAELAADSRLAGVRVARLK
jgi:SAM-dependent methyltransferase